MQFGSGQVIYDGAKAKNLQDPKNSIRRVKPTELNTHAIVWQLDPQTEVKEIENSVSDSCLYVF